MKIYISPSEQENNIYAVGGLQAIYNAIQFSGDSITSVRLYAHTTYKIAGGKLLLYGRR